MSERTYTQEVEVTKIVTYVATVTVEFDDEDADIDELVFESINIDEPTWELTDEEFETYHL